MGLMESQHRVMEAGGREKEIPGDRAALWVAATALRSEMKKQERKGGKRYLVIPMGHTRMQTCHGLPWSDLWLLLRLLSESIHGVKSLRKTRRVSSVV
jgi:hypothetical protein